MVLKIFLSEESYDLFKAYGAISSHVYLCRGACADSITPLAKMRTLSAREKRIREFEIEYAGDEDFSDPFVTVYYSYDSGSSTIKGWYTRPKMEEAYEQIKKSGFHLRSTICNTVIIAPVDLTATVQVYFRPGDDGRPFVRLNLHPERDGHETAGKIYFPCYDFKGARPGNAEIDLSTVEDFPSYGFVNGKMMSYSTFDEDSFIESLANSQDDVDSIEKYSGSLGEYYVMRRKGKAYKVYYMQGKRKEVSWPSFAETIDKDHGDRLVWRSTYREYLISAGMT